MKAPWIGRIIVTLALLTGCAAPRTLGGESSHDMPLRPYVGQLRTVQIDIAGHPATLIFDTGAGITAITPEFAATVGCRPHAHISGFRMNGERVSFQRCDALSVQIGGERSERELGVFDLAAVLPEGLPHVDGIAGLDIFDGRTITLLPGLSGVRVETASMPQNVAATAPGHLRLGREAGGVGLTAFARAQSPQGDIWLLLDSGNLAGVRLHPWAAAALGAPTGATATRRVNLSVEGAEAAAVDAQVVDDLIYDGALDAGFIEAHEVTLDLQHGRVWWRTAPH